MSVALSRMDSLLLSEYAKRFGSINESSMERWCPVEPHPKQLEFINITAREALYGGAGGGGKACDLNTCIPTPSGWSIMGDVHPGDWVFGIDGMPIKVVAESPVMFDRPCYKITFDDGEQITVDAEHLWFTYSEKELTSIDRCSDEWRAKRRAKRPSRAKASTSEKHKAALAKHNSEMKHKLRTPSGSIKTTEKIFSTSKRPHAVPLTASLVLPDADLPLDPYLLGLWLGNGAKSSGQYTTSDEETVGSFLSCGFSVHKCESRKYHYYVSGLQQILRPMGLIGNKHVPEQYLRASSEQRLALLQGLMDTDGYCATDGRVEFCNTNKQIADSAFELAISLGLKATIIEGRAQLNGEDYGPKWRVCWTSPLKVFRVERKACRLKKGGFRRTTKMRYMIKVEPVQSVPVKCIQVDREDGMYLVGRHMIPTHNSFCLLMIALEHVNKPNYRCLILRRTLKSLNQPGALMDVANSWLMGMGADWKPADKKWVFPSGAVIQFGYLEIDKDLENYQGPSYHTIIFDELTQFTKYQYTYMLSRNRRDANDPIPLKIRSASNPGGVGHDWVFERFVKNSGTKYMYVPARIDDNPSLNREEYKETLAELDPIRQAQLLEGLWIKDEATIVMPYDDELNGSNDMPTLPNAKYILSIDLGASEDKKTTAFSLLGFSYQRPNLVVGIECETFSGMIPSTMASKINEYQERYDIMRIVMDTGGLGVGYANEIQRRYAIPITPAKKADRLGYIRLMKGDMRLGHIKLLRKTNAPLVQELEELTWKDERQLEMVAKDGKKMPSDHAFDSFLYGWRECRHWQAIAPTNLPAPGTRERYQLEEQKMQQHAERRSSQAVNEETRLTRKRSMR